MDAAEATCLDEVYRAVRETCKQAMGTLNDLMISKLLSDSYADGRLKDWISGEEAIAWFSARVATKTSLQVNRRLKQSLKEESNSPFSKLIWELPGTVRIELEDLVREGEPPSALARRVAKHLEELGGQSAKLQRKGKLVEGESSDITTNESMLEEFLAKEELEELRISSGLSERECQVLELMLAQYNGKEIAEKLEISQGSVKTYKRRLCEKLRQAAG
jgi:DNA-directed RNA polymerase specialized sigma24 family protein